MARKHDADEICAHLEALRRTLPTTLDWWPRYIFHSARVRTAASILNLGLLMSRAVAKERGLLAEDSAAKSIVDSLTDADRRLVRFYFRPKTPTQYTNEGIRPLASIDKTGGHMPVPVYLMFNAPDVVCQQGVVFTKGRLRRTSRRDGTADFLRSIPFADVYHDGPRTGPRAEEIKDARHSEVLVPDQIDLAHLQFVVCRSAAERETLLNLVAPPTRLKWQGKIILPGARSFFCDRWNYVSSVSLEAHLSSFRFHRAVEAAGRGPFEVSGKWRSPEWAGTWAQSYDVLPETLKINLKQPRTTYRVELSLNGDLAYAGVFNEATQPQVG